MLDYNFYARVTLVGEVLPNPANTVTLSGEKDEYGMPRPMVTFSYGENDRKLFDHAVVKMQEIHRRGGRRAEVSSCPDTAHLMGGCRMGKDPRTSVADEWGRAHDHENLYLAGAPTLRDRRRRQPDRDRHGPGRPHGRAPDRGDRTGVVRAPSGESPPNSFDCTGSGNSFRDEPNRRFEPCHIGQGS